MLVSYKWLCQITGLAPDPAELGDRFTFSGLEVDEITECGQGFANVVVGVIKTREPHPTKDQLHVVTVDSGAGELQVVCGAPNTPGPGSRVVLAAPGARVGEIEIGARKLAGVESAGMLCSEAELGIGPDEDGIMILDAATDDAPGTPIVDALDLADWIYDLGITPNRPDALSHRGLAREMALLLEQPFAPAATAPAPEAGPEIGELAQVELLDSELCPRYAAAVLTGLAVGPSPFALRYRLHNLGIRPISNLVDVTNLMLLEWGQPLHAFDLSRLAGSRIVVRRAAPGERMTTLDDVERTFTDDDLLICDGERPVAVAGVMGGLDTGIGAQTTSLLIECAYFRPTAIRRTSKRLKLASESSYRFERGVDPNQAPDVLAAAAALTQQLAGGVKAPGIIDCYPQPIGRRAVTLRPARYEVLMGDRAAPAEMRRILSGLGATVAGTDELLEVAVPTARPDIEREVDLIEEVARIRGLDKVSARLPRIQCTIPDREEFEVSRRARELLAASGLDEAISYSFVPEELLRELGRGEGVTRIANPLSSARAAMRTTLLAGLLESLGRAHSRSVPSFAQFEVGRTFHDEGAELPREVLRAAALLSGPRPRWVGAERSDYDFFDAKGLALGFCEQLTGRLPRLQPAADVPFLHPRRAVRAQVGDRVVGVIGELHPELLARQKLPAGAVAFELELLALWDQRRPPAARPIPEFPAIARDVALLVAEQQDVGPLQAALHEACGALAADVQLFDVYRGQGIEPGKKSLAFSVTYRAPDRTLTEDEIDAIHRAAVEQISVAFSARVR